MTDTDRTNSPADLVPAQEPDLVTNLSRAALCESVYDADLTPYADFQGIGYSLGVYLLRDLNGYAVAPSSVSGPPRAMARADVRYFYGSDSDLPAAYARACLWALRQVVTDVDAETNGF